MGLFAGFVALEGTIKTALLVKGTNNAPANSANFPTFRVYSSSGYLSLNGTTTFLNSAAITGVTLANPAVVTSNAHNLQTGNRVTITDVQGPTNANTTTTVTRLDANTFSLDGVNTSGQGAYVANTGTWNLTGAYRASVDCTAANGFVAGENYSVLYAWTLSGVAGGDIDSWMVT